ncbi:MAG TPA: F0F1 ATP synthase subunit delta [Candidatus Saccharibacteria bacterium]|nr:F0F1 ATP synthase subunit delta [Candidatus Saccharibacteria bacterium]
MARRISRRQLAAYVAQQLQNGKRALALRQLAGYLVDTRRTKELEVIVRDVMHHLARSGIVHAQVVSAFALSKEAKAFVKELVVQQTNATDVSLHSVIDERVLGGLKISIPGKELDTTVAHHLATLRTTAKKV